MSEETELIFGLYRYIKKASEYLGSKTSSEMIKDQKTFDAICFCFVMIEEIAKRILKNKKILEEVKDVDFKKIASYKKEIFINDGLDYMKMYEVIQNEFPFLQIKLGEKIGAITYGK